MRTSNRLTIGLIIGCLLFLGLQNIVYAEPINNELLSHFKSLISQSDRELNQYDQYNQSEPVWFPGFLIVQLIKGIIAFILIILILLDVIEPTN